MLDGLKKYGSRKFLLVIAACVVKFLYPETPDELLILVLGYVGIEGTRDIFAAVTNAKIAVKTIEKDISLIDAGEIPAGDVARNRIVAGH